MGFTGKTSPPFIYLPSTGMYIFLFLSLSNCFYIWGGSYRQFKFYTELHFSLSISSSSQSHFWSTGILTSRLYVVPLSWSECAPRGSEGRASPAPRDLGWGVIGLDPPHSDILLKQTDATVNIPIHFWKFFLKKNRKFIKDKQWLSG